MVRERIRRRTTVEKSGYYFHELVEFPIDRQTPATVGAQNYYCGSRTFTYGPLGCTSPLYPKSLGP
jgi:hypothetical protein